MRVTSRLPPRYWKDELRAMTNSVRKRDSSVMMSSVMPSLKYRCSGSSLRLRNGSTAIEGLAAASAACPAAGSLSGAAIGAARWRMRSYSAVVAGSGCTPISR